MKSVKEKKYGFSGLRRVCAWILLIALCISFPAGSITAMATETSEDLEIVSADNVSQTGYDVVYVIDNSMSIWGYDPNYQDPRNQAFKNITNLAEGSDINIGVVYFADHIYSTLGLTSMMDEDSSKKVLSFLDMNEEDESNRDTNIGNAFEAAIQLFEDQDSSRKRIIILFSDGMNENYDQIKSYKDEADAKTEEQTKILQQMGVSIYCVYLQKDRNDEDYLKQIVNYFSTDVDYTADRFMSVPADDVDSLSASFVDVFYNMQGDMKYRNLEFDSTGSMSFYVPSLGINKLRVYLDGDLESGTELTPAGDSEHQKWTDGNSVFLVYDDPVPGNWSIDVVSNDMSGVTGTLAMYVNLKASSEVVDAEDGKKQLVVHFYDEDNNKIDVDSSVTVTASVNYTAEGAEAAESTPITMTIEDGDAVSQSFDMKGYGDYTYSVELTYSDYIDLKYTLGNESVGKSAPTTTDMNAILFPAEKTDKGYQFAIKESKLWTDPEGESVEITGITQLNAVNAVTSWEQHDGYVYLYAEKALLNDTSVELSLQDASGMTAEVTVTGKVLNQAILRIIIICSAAFIILLVVLSILKVRKNKRDKSGLEGQFQEFEQTVGEFNAAYESCGRLKQASAQNMKQMKTLLHGNGQYAGLIEMTANFTDDEKNVFGVSEFNEEYFDTMRENTESLVQNLENVNTEMSDLKADEEAIHSTSKNVKSSAARMNDRCGAAKDLLQRLTDCKRALSDNNLEISAKTNVIRENAANIYDIINGEIRCTLTVKRIDRLPGAYGLMNNRGFDGSVLTGFYPLGSIENINAKNRTLDQQLGNLGIYVCSYEDEETGMPGLTFKSAVPFRIAYPDGRKETTVSAVLMKRQTCQLTMETPNQGITTITLSAS